MQGSTEQLYEIHITASFEGRDVLIITGRVNIKQDAPASYSCELSGPKHLVIGLSDTEDGTVLEVVQMLISIAQDALAAGERDFPDIAGIEWIPAIGELSIPPTASELLTPQWEHSAVPA